MIFFYSFFKENKHYTYELIIFLKIKKKKKKGGGAQIKK